MKNKTIKRAALLLTTLFLAIYPASAQEYVVSYTGHSAVDQIIRAIDNTTNLVCNNFSTNGYAYIMQKDGVTSFDYFFLSNDITAISDFEIYNDTVFFCGTISKAYGDIGLFGYFPLAYFPNPVVTYIEIPWMSTLKKLEVERFADSLHVVTTAKTLSGRSAIIDALNKITYWNVNYYIADSSVVSFDDVAISSNYVVFSSLVSGRTFNSGRFWFVSKPTSSGASIMPALSSTRSFSIAGSPILLQACRADTILAVFPYGLLTMLPVTLPVRIMTFNGIYNINNFSFSKTADLVYLKNIRYNKTDRLLGIDIITATAGTTHSHIYTFKHPVAPLPSSIQSHGYANVGINSIDAISSNQFVAAGKYGNGLYMFKFTHNIWNNCFDNDTVQIVTNSYNFIPNNAYLRGDSLGVLIKTMNTSKKNDTMQNICN